MAHSQNLALDPPKPMRRLFKWLRIFFIAYIISEILVGLGAVLSLVLGSAMFGPGEPFTSGDILTGLGGLALLITFIACVILFSIFSYRAVKNIHKFGAIGIDTTPGWAVGWYFVPFANLWKPYGVMDEIWDGSHQGDQAPDYSPSTLGLWWMFWIVSNIASNVSFRMSLRAGLMDDYASDVPLYKITLMIDVFSSVTGVLAALLILPILAKIAFKQDQRINANTFS